MGKLSNITFHLHHSAHSALAITHSCLVWNVISHGFLLLTPLLCLYLCHVTYPQRACLYLQSILCFLTSYHASFFSTAFLTILWLPFWKLSSLRSGTWSVFFPLWHKRAQVNARVNHFLYFIQWAEPKWNLCNLNYELDSNWSTESMMAAFSYFSEREW